MTRETSRILRLEVPVIVELGRKIVPLGDVVALIPGTIIELPKKAEEELELLANNKLIGTGTAVKVGENFGIRISFVGDVASRIAALGPHPAGPPAPTPPGEPPGAEG